MVSCVRKYLILGQSKWKFDVREGDDYDDDDKDDDDGDDDDDLL